MAQSRSLSKQKVTDFRRWWNSFFPFWQLLQEVVSHWWPRGKKGPTLWPCHSCVTRPATQCNPKPERCDQNASAAHAAALAQGQSLLPEDWKLPQQRADSQSCSQGPSRPASLCHHGTCRVPQSVQGKALAEACATSRGRECGAHDHTLSVVYRTVVFTSVYKVKPPALILCKNKTMGQVHDSEGLVQIFAK